MQLLKRLKIKWKIALRQCVYHLLSGCKKENQLRVWPIRSGVVRQTLSRCANASTFCPSEGGLITFFHLRKASQPSSLHFNPAVLRSSKTHSQPEPESFIYIHTLRGVRERELHARSLGTLGRRTSTCHTASQNNWPWRLPAYLSSSISAPGSSLIGREYQRFCSHFERLSELNFKIRTYWNKFIWLMLHINLLISRVFSFLLLYFLFKLLTFIKNVF